MVLRLGILFSLSPLALAQTAAPHLDSPFHPRNLKKLPIEQLAELEIVSVSRRPERLSLAPSAIDVITSEEIRRSGVTNLPDALRLAAGLHVAQIDGHTWAVSARGFNTSAGNKMQVLMDGRSLYTPLFSGVFWDVQQTFLPDVEQIEVVPGPGGTLWGANAVNGVINIRSKSAKDTQGFLLYGGAGNQERGFGGLRYGGKVGNTFYRAYVMHRSRDDLTFENTGLDSKDDFTNSQAGARIDSQLSPDDLLTLQGDIYTGGFGQFGASEAEVAGGNVIARWTRDLRDDGNLILQAYYDRTHRLLPGVFEEDRNTYDVELQHRLKLGTTHDIVWGLNYRASEDRVGNLGPSLAFLPEHETVHLAGGYIQDDIHLIPNRLTVTLGSKFEHNSFSGFEVQPTARFALIPGHLQTIWGAISRAVRTPTRIDQDLFAPNPRFLPATGLRTTNDFDSEKLIAYELGYRIRPVGNLSIDLALFYNDYDDVRSVEPGDSAGDPLVLENRNVASAYGAELKVKWQPTRWWELDLGYKAMSVNIHRGPGGRDVNNGSGEGNDPNHMFVLRSSMDLPGNVELDVFLRYVDRLPQPQTPAYLTADVRLGWTPREGLELAIVGRNLLDDNHPEFRGAAVSREVPRSVYGMITWRF